MAALGRLLSAPAAAARHANQVRRRRMALLHGGASRLIDQIEWDVERVLHVGRLVLWTGLSALLIFGLNVSPGAMLASMISTVARLLTGGNLVLRVEPGSPQAALFSALFFLGGWALWLVYWWLLHRGTRWRWLRFVVIVADVLSLLRFAVATRSAAFLGMQGEMTADLLGGLLPAIWVTLIFAGAVRLNPFTAGLSGVSAIGAQLATAALLELPGSHTLAYTSLLALTLMLGMNLVFILRGMALKAAEEEVLERFVPQGLTQRLAHAGGTVPARVVPVTILIADIRGFTTMSEPLGPAEAVGLLNRFFATMVGPLAAEDAVLDKYLGDGLLAFVEGDKHAVRGLRAARNIVRSIEETNAERVAEGEAPIRMGVAVHTASAFVGSIGAPSRMEYTIIGDAVNVTSRLEGLMSSKAGAERIPATIVVSGDAVRAAREDGYEVSELEGPRNVSVHGRAQPLEVYYLPAALD
ncbi:MAG TPA: adenylate/guanylate cyclase domain-containing protein [Chloroflexota bacterium]|nr:adenylate/guanylate cyclase domain-containing protein [Chloroflexota bacterium]